MGGSVTALLGTDAAFPSRVAAILAGMESPWSGTATVGRRRLPVRDRAARRLIGYVPAASPGPAGMTVMGVLSLAASAGGRGRAGALRSAREMMEWCRLPGEGDTRIRDLDRDRAFALSFATALMHNPSVVIIDHEVPEQFYGHLEGLKSSGRAIVVTAGDMGSLPPCTDRVALCTGTDLVRTMARAELLETASRATETWVAFCPSVSRGLLEGLPGLESLTAEQGGFRLRHPSPHAALSWILNVARANSRTIAGLHTRPPDVARLVELCRGGEFPGGLFGDGEVE